MALVTWMRTWYTRIVARQGSRHGRRKKARPRPFRPLLEILEDRTVPSFVVNTLSDGGPGSLRDQVAAAESAGPNNKVTFQPGQAIHGGSRQS
jgi:hypothetical protein